MHNSEYETFINNASCLQPACIAFMCKQFINCEVWK